MGAYEDQLQSMFDSIGAPAPAPAQQQGSATASDYQSMFDELGTSPAAMEAAPPPTTQTQAQADMATLDDVGLGGAARFVQALPTIPARIASSYKKGEATDSVVDGIGTLRQHMLDLKEVSDYLTPEGKLNPQGMERFNPFNDRTSMDEMGGLQGRPMGGSFNKMGKALAEGQSLDEYTAGLNDQVQEQLDVARNTLMLEEFTGPKAGKYMQALMDTPGELTGQEAFDVATSGEAIVGLMADTLIPSLLIGAGSLVGGAVGTVMLPGGGTAAGAAAGAYLVSSGMETRRAFMDGLIDAEVDVFDVEAIQEFVTKNPRQLQDIITKADRQGAAVGALDAVSVGFGGRILKKVMDAAEGMSIASKVARGGGAMVLEQAAQGIYGATGAAAGKVFSGQQVDWDETFLEFMGEIYGGGLMDVAIGSVASRVDRLRAEKRKIADEQDAYATNDAFDVLVEKIDKDSREQWRADVEALKREDDIPVDDETVDQLDLNKDNYFADEAEGNNETPPPPIVEPGSSYGDRILALQAQKEAERLEREAKAAENKAARAERDRTIALEKAREQGRADPEERKQTIRDAYNEGRGVVPEPTAEPVAPSTVAEPATTEAGTLAEVNAKIDAGVQKNVAELDQTTDPLDAAIEDVDKMVEEGKKRKPIATPKAPDVASIMDSIQDVDEFEKELAPVLETDTTVEEEQAPPAYEPDILAQEVAAIEGQGFTDAEIAGLGKAAGITIDGTATPEDKQAIAEWMLDNNDMDPAEARTIMLDALAGKVDNRVAEEKPPTTEKDEKAKTREATLLAESEARLQAIAEEEQVAEEEAKIDAGIVTKRIDKATKQSELDAEKATPLRPRAAAAPTGPVRNFTSQEILQIVNDTNALGDARSRNRALLGSLNNELHSRASIVHLTKDTLSGDRRKGKGANKTGHWEFTDVTEDNKFVLEWTALNEDGSPRFKKVRGTQTADPMSAIYHVDFVNGTVELYATTGGVARQKPMGMGKNSIGELIFAAHARAYRNNPLLADTSTTLEELGATATKEQHVQKIKTRIEYRRAELAQQNKTLDRYRAELDDARDAMWRAKDNPDASSYQKNDATDKYYEAATRWKKADNRQKVIMSYLEDADQQIKDAENAQDDMIAKLTEITARATDEAGNPVELKNITKRMGVRPEDAGKGIQTFMDGRHLTGILRSERQRGFAIQVLPNGTVRALRIEAELQGEKLAPGASYTATVEQVSGAKLKKPVTLGPTGFKINRTNVKKLVENARDKKARQAEGQKAAGADDAGRRTARPGDPTPRGLSEQARKESKMDQKERTGAVTEADKVVIGVLSQRAANMKNKLDLTRALLNAKRGIEGAADAQGLVDAVVNEETRAKLQAELDEIKGMTEPQLVERFADLEAGIAVTNAKIAKAGGSQTTGAQSKGETRRVGPVYTTDPATGERVPTPDVQLKSVEEWPFAFPAEYKQNLAYEKGRTERLAKEQEVERIKALKGNAAAKLKSLKLKDKKKAGAARRSLMQLHVNEINQMFQGPQLREVAELMGIRPKRSRADTAMAIREQAKQEIEAWEAENNQQVERRPEAEGVTPQQRADALMQQRGEAPQRFVTLGYILELQDSLRKQGHSEVMIEQVVKDVIDSSKGIDPAAKRAAYTASQIAQKERTQQETAPATPVATRDEVEQYLMVQNAIKQAADPTTETGVITEKLIDAIHGAGTTEQLEGFASRSPYYEGVTEFARTPVMSGGKTKLQAEMDALREQGAGVPEESRQVLTLPNPKERAPIRKFGVKNKIVTIEEAQELERYLGTKLRSGLTPEDFTALVKLSAYYVEGGARAFADFVQEVYDKVGAVDTKVLMDAWRKAGGAAIEEADFAKPAPKVAGPDPIEGPNPSNSLVLDAEKLKASVATPLSAELDKLTGKPVEIAESQKTVKVKNLTDGSSFERGTVRGTSNNLNRWRKLWTLASNTLIGEGRHINTLIRQTRARVNGHVMVAQNFAGRYMAAIQDANIKIGSSAHRSLNRAVTAMLDGMSQSQAEQKFNTTIPEPIVTLAQGMATVKAELAREAVEIDALPTHVRSAIEENNGEIWLHKSFQNTPMVTALFQDTIGGGKTAMEKIAALDPRLKDRILKSAHIRFGVPADPADLKYISRDTLASWVGDANSLYPSGTIEGTNTRILDGMWEEAYNTADMVEIDQVTGKPMMRPVTVENATQEQLAEWILDQPMNKDFLETWVMNEVNSLFDPSALTQDVYVSDGADTSISRKRKLMLSDGEQIGGMINELVNSKHVPIDTKNTLRELKSDLVTMDRRRFEEQVMRIEDPAVRAIVSRRAAEYDIADSIRRGLGEVTDPGQLMTDSMTRLASNTEMSRMVSQIVAHGVKTGDLSFEQRETDNKLHTHALGVEGIVGTNKPKVIMGMSNIRYTNPRGGVQNIIEKGSATIRGNKDTITAIHDLLNAHASTANSGVVNASYALSALAKYDKVILNPAAHPRNMMGSAQIALARGVFGTAFNPFTWPTTKGGSMVTGTALSLSELEGSFGRRGQVRHQRRLMSKPQLESLARILTDRGIAHDSIHAGALLDVFAHMQTLPPNEWQKSLASGSTLLQLGGKAAGATTQGVTNKLSEVLGKVSGVAEEFFRLEDEAVKAVGFMQRTKQFMAILEDFSEEGLGGQKWRKQAYSADALLEQYLDPASREKMSQDEIDLVTRAMDMAEENIVATFPTFSQAPEMIKRLSRHPIVGAFPTFQAEMLRNTYNQLAFASGLIFRRMPNGVRLDKGSKAAARARVLGIGLLGQQSLVGLGQLSVLSALNSAALLRKGSGKADDDPGLALMEALSRNLDNYNIYPVKNVVASYFKNSALAVMPGGINGEDGTITLVNLGWTVPEGAWYEGGYTFTNDLVDVLTNEEFSENHRMRVAWEIMQSAGEVLLNIFGNEEVMFRSVVGNMLESDGASPESLTSEKRKLTRKLNQYLREVGGLGDKKYLDGDNSRTNNVVRFGAASIASVFSELPPTTAIAQFKKGYDEIVTVAEMEGDLGVKAWELFKDGAAISTGFRVEKFDYRVDYPKTIYYSHAPQLAAKGKRIRDELFDPTEEYTYEEFKHQYKLYDKYRRKAFDNLAAGLEFGQSRMGVRGAELEKVFLDGTRGSSMVDGFSLYDFKNKSYSPITYLSDQQYQKALDNFERQGLTRSDLDERAQWLRMAARDR